MIDFFFNYGPVNIIRAKAQRNLRDLRRHHLPVGLDVGEVVEHQATDGDLANVGESAGLGKMVESGVVGMEGQRNKRLEAAGFVLQGAQAEQMIDAVLIVFDVAVQHGGVRTHP